jgi:leader peptidase (prepilin peptidase)/N-methyltransferase
MNIKIINQENIIPAVIIVWLLLCSIQDIKKKKISIGLMIAGFLLLSVITGICGSVTILNRIVGLILGIVLLCISYVTRGQIGIGDGLIVCITGFSLGFIKNSLLLLYALFGSAIFSAVLLFFCHVNRHKTIPFVPFLFFGYLGVLMFA